MKELNYYLVILFNDNLLDVEANMSFVDVLIKMIQLKHIPSPGDVISIKGWDGFDVKHIDFNYWTEKPVIEIITDFPNFSDLKAGHGGYSKKGYDGHTAEYFIFKAGYERKYNALLKKIYNDYE
jgi:hypothetical protein